MNEPDSNERISALVDGELGDSVRNRTVDALYASPERRRAWARFHLIGDAMRHAGPVPGADSIAGRVGGVLAGERIVAFRPRRRRPGVGPLAGLALAASISAVAVLVIHSLDDGSGPRPAPVADGSRYEVATASPVAGIPDSGAPPVAGVKSRDTRRNADRLQWSDVAPDTEARLNAYLVNHSEHAGNGVPGVLPYVRLVAYQSVAGDQR